MSKLRTKLSLAILFLGFSKLSYGAILIEPHLGYNLKGSADYSGNVSVIVGGQRVTAPVSFSDKYSGLQYGGRIGLQYTPGLMFGFDYNASKYSIKETPKDGSPSDTDDYKRSEIGAFVGVSLPLKFRIWYSYYITTQTATKTNVVSGVSEGDKNDGNSSEIGLGFAGLPFMSFNVLYRMMNYNDGNSKAGGGYTISPDYKAKEIVLGISLPITL